MNKTEVIIAAVAILAVIIAILLYNKSQSESKSRAEIQTSLPVSVTTVKRQKPSDVHSAVGTISAHNDVLIISETQGKVTAVMAEVGDYRQAGSELIQVDDELKKANFATAEVNYEKAKKDLERYESLFKQNSATDQQIEGARLAAKAAESQYVSARREYTDTKITTPISGTVTSRLVDIGTYVQRGMPVADVVDISTLKVKVSVAELDVFRLNAGERVKIHTDVYPGIEFEGRIKTISSKADEAHTYPVEITLGNSKEHPLKAGMFARVDFTFGARNEQLTIPRGALVGSTKQPQVFVLDGTIARLRNIVVGSEFGTQLAVVDGLREGETVVVNGQNNLKDSVAVSVIK